MGYTKLFSEIVLSTIWRESNPTRILWITMLALRNEYHKVEASIPGLADAARITLQECEEGLRVLMSPDPYSRSQEHEGRRIEQCDGGWYILNGEKFRHKMNADDRRRYKAEKQREYRARGQGVDRSGHRGHSRVEHSKEEKNGRFAPPSHKEVAGYMTERGCKDAAQPDRFINFYESKGWMVGKNKMKDWKAAVRNWLGRIEGEAGTLSVVTKIKAMSEGELLRQCNAHGITTRGRTDKREVFERELADRMSQ